MPSNKYYNILSLAFILLLLLSNIAEIKICLLFGYSLGAGTIIFPLLYVINNILTEIYGFSACRNVIWIALCCNCIFGVFVYLITLLPPSPFFEYQQAFEEIFLLSPQIIVASVISYFVGELSNSFLLSMMKIKLNGKFFVIRAVISTFVASSIESFIFTYIAFFTRLPRAELLEMIILLTIIKTSYEIILMPLSIKIIRIINDRY